MPVILKQFLRYLSEKKNYSPKTIKAYSQDLLLFFEFLKQYLEIKVDIKKFNVFILSNVKEETIFAFLVYLNYHRNNIAETRQRRLATLKTFFKWLYCIKAPSFRSMENPVQNISSIPKMFKLPKYLNFKQAMQIQSVFNTSNCRYPERNNAIITLFLHNGIRISELINLCISDINFEKKTAKFVAKGNVERNIYLNDYTINKIKQYLDTRNDNINALFISNRNKKLSIDMIDDICKRAFQLIGIQENLNFSAHTLRHTAGTIIFRETKDLLITKEFLGHKSISSTEIYTHVENQDLKHAVEKNPLSNFNL